MHLLRTGPSLTVCLGLVTLYQWKNKITRRHLLVSLWTWTAVSWINVLLLFISTVHSTSSQYGLFNNYYSHSIEKCKYWLSKASINSLQLEQTKCWFWAGFKLVQPVQPFKEPVWFFTDMRATIESNHSVTVCVSSFPALLGTPGGFHRLGS